MLCLDQFLNQNFDCVITVCDHANEVCPFFPGGKKRIHKGFKDRAVVPGSDETKKEPFRRVRDQIRAWLQNDLPHLCF